MAIALIVSIALGVVALVAALDWLVMPKVDSSEPPVLHPTIPIIGHAIGVIREGPWYWSRLNRRNSMPAYTLRLPGERIYMLRTPEMVAQGDRMGRFLSFGPVLVDLLQRLTSPTPFAIQELEKNMEHDGHWGLRVESNTVVRGALGRSENLAEISCLLGRSIYGFCHDLPRSQDTGALGHGRFKMVQWSKSLATQVMSDSVWGPTRNPYRDPAFAQGFWDMMSQVDMLLLRMAPWLTAPVSFKGRQVLLDGFKKYYQGDVSSAGPLVRNRLKVNKAHGIGMRDIERFDLAVSMGVIVNSVPTAFWVIYYIYSHPGLLADLRNEIESRLVDVASPGPDGVETRSVDLVRVIDNCPKLFSVCEEVVRLKFAGLAVRRLLKDMPLDGRYVLKKGSLVMSTAELHMDPAVWGQNALEFDPDRFMPGHVGASVPTASSRMWGGGSSVCPGRRTLLNEAHIIAAMLVLQYEIAPFPPGAPWREPQSSVHGPLFILTPNEDLEVTVTDRPGLDKVKWHFHCAGTPVDDDGSKAAFKQADGAAKQADGAAKQADGAAKQKPVA